MKILLLVLVAGVVVSLFLGLYFVYKDKGTTNRAAIALTVRVALSALVIAILLGGYLLGFFADGKIH